MRTLSDTEMGQLRALDVGRTYGRPLWMRPWRRRYVSLRRAHDRGGLVRFRLWCLAGALAVGLVILTVGGAAIRGWWQPPALFVVSFALLAAFYTAHIRSGVVVYSPEGARLVAIPTAAGVELSDFSRWSYTDEDKDSVLSADAESLARATLLILHKHNVLVVPRDSRLTHRYREAGFIEGGTVDELCRATRVRRLTMRRSPPILRRPPETGSRPAS